MPFILKHRESDEVFTTTLKNIYNLYYYGTKYWDDGEEAEQERESFLDEMNAANKHDWELIEVDERLLKLCNVKLANNPSLKLLLDEQGKPYVEPSGL